MKPLRPEADWIAVAADRTAIGELQSFYESNPDYWRLVHGHAPAADEAEQRFRRQAAGRNVSYSALTMWLIRDRESQRVIGEVSAAVDLLAPGSCISGFFIVDAARQGTGFAA